MSFTEYLKEFGGLPVVAFPPDPEKPVPEVEGPVAWRIDCWHDEFYQKPFEFTEIFERFLKSVDTTRTTALTVGMWDETAEADGSPVVDLLTGNADRFPALRSLFLGDIFEGGDGGSDTAYIEHGDLTPILRAYPELEELWVRGGTPWRGPRRYFEPLRHDALQRLVLQSGGLHGQLMRAVAECEFPDLRHLEFYFGHPEYGGDGTPADVAWVLSGETLPKLEYLGLRDSVVQDEIAAAVAHAPVVARLKTLDLSLGALGDEGAAALLAGQPLGHLDKLDLHYHFISDEMRARLRQAWPGVEVDLSAPQVEDDEWGRFIAVAE